MGEYNQISTAPMSLVMFRFAIEHVSRVCRVLSQPGGNSLLIGVGGSGRQSAAKLATFIQEYDCFQLEITRTYALTDWKDDMKRLLLRAGVDGKPTTFLFGDQQIKDEAFLEDISALLSAGDIPNLFPADEKMEILEKVSAVARNLGKKIDPNPLALYGYFIERVKENLHVVLAFSPIGDALRNRLRSFPSFIAGTTGDWFHPWPEDALEMVANTFLNPLKLEQKEHIACVSMCKHFHENVRDLSVDFDARLSRKNYLTPTNYLELIMTFKQLLNRERQRLLDLRNRYVGGLDQLAFAETAVDQMKKDIIALQPELEKTSIETQKIMEKIAIDKVDVDAKKEVVLADEATANAAAASAKEIKTECETDLAVAMPALQSAVSALNTLKPSDISNLKSMSSPPELVRTVLEAICIMKGIKPERKPDANGKMADDYWGQAKKMLGDMKFLDSLKTYDKDNIPGPTIKKIRDKYVPLENFNSEAVAKVSTACEGMVKWVLAMEVYERVNKVVIPKKIKLAEAEKELGEQMALLKRKQAELKEVVDKLTEMEDDFAAKQAKLKELTDNINLCKLKLTRASQLIDGLGGEKVSWTKRAEELADKLTCVTGDVLLASSYCAYMGPFTADFREAAINNWMAACKKVKINHSPKFSLTDILGDPVLIRNWRIFGLPADAYSTDNAIILSSSRRWPLMIDPQGQANKWVKNMEKDNQVHALKMSNPNYLRTLETAIQFGQPVILENVLEELEAVLEPVLLRQTFKQGGIECIKLGDSTVEWNKDFRFYMTTVLRNPHYLPEVSVKVCILNFMITEGGLSDQLLGIVTQQERPDLEEIKNQHIIEDETAIQVLPSSKVLSEEINTKQAEAAKTEIKIDETRSGYMPTAEHAAVLFFCVQDLAGIEPMYQYSLNWFVNLFIVSIVKSRPDGYDATTANIQERTAHLNEHFTAGLFNNICRSLFEKDKLLFSFILTCSLMKKRGDLDEPLFRFLLTGGVAIGEDPESNPYSARLPDKSWAELGRAGQLPPFKDQRTHELKTLRADFKKEADIWKKNVFDSISPQDATFPAPYDKISSLARLAVLRCLRPDKVVPAVLYYITEGLNDRRFVEPPGFDLVGSFSDATNKTPLTFVLSPGADPMAALQKLATDMNMFDKMETISLGQGQGPIAQRMISEAIQCGGWVVLQNCHLAVSWMGALEKICEEFEEREDMNEDFRLWLTSYPSNDFPVSILQNSIKMTNEPPRGLRANLLRSYTSDPIADPEFFNCCSKEKPWRKLLFSLCFFHGLIQERRKFGPLGWNIKYEFNESDLRISMRQVAMFLDEYEYIPLPALSYLTGECNYGGRVTDGQDRRCLTSMLDLYFSMDCIDDDDYRYSDSGQYYAPPHGEYDSYINYIKSLPIDPLPEVFGLHENADIARQQAETQLLFDSVLITLPRASGGAGASPQQVVEMMSADLLNKLPNVFASLAVSRKFPIVYNESMNTVLKQELIRFNRLIAAIRASLINLGKAVKGLVVMNNDLEEVFDAMLIGRIPDLWLKRSYPSLKKMGGYVADLVARLKFLQDWIDQGHAPYCFWISGFYFPQSFMTAVNQNFARKYKIPIDLIGFSFEITKSESPTDIKEKPEDGAYINGLYFDGALWDRERHIVNESQPKVLFDSVPVIRLVPTPQNEINRENTNACPVYKTSERKGMLSTTGHSTNFVLWIDFPSNREQRHWINRGVAALCSLDD